MSQQTDADYVDPRSNITHRIDEGQRYEDTRADDELLLLFCSEDVVLLRDTGDADNESWIEHRIERRDQFEKNVGAGRYELLSSEGEATTRGKVRKLKQLLERYEDDDGRKAEHKATALEEALTMLQQDEAPDANETVDFESVSGIGAKTASNLRANGFEVKKDIRNADDDELLDVGGMGESNLANLRDHVGDR